MGQEDCTLTSRTETAPFTLLAVVQGGRLQYEALLLMASLKARAPDSAVRVVLAEPVLNDAWTEDPSIADAETRQMLVDLGTEIVPFDAHPFGARYPHGNKIAALSILPEGEPFLFLDTDTLIQDDPLGVPFDFDRPGASARVSGTWPVPDLYGPEIGDIWKSLYDRAGLDFESSLDLSQPEDYWRRYLYFNAGYFYYRCPRDFGALYRELALMVENDPPPELDGQALYPWLDQITLPLVIHALGGGRDSLAPGYLDGSVTCHYRTLPLLYAREADETVALLEEICAPNKLKKLLKPHEPIRKLVYQGGGAKARRLFKGRRDLPEDMMRKRLRNHGLWLR
ncbi:hypothetical protein [Oceanomicrobium pacificus]|uniref:Glycosyl transferase n=1 Tax=Oceanomicrobium pacificus TaxID=2692916 RepID=A0A6B0THL9_9RHOB|nr:hypothetical protein [Oceanomicrobium pacificus]MXU63907.1 hypothetical protein [Oceanomicrobium pacificus]